MTTRDGQDDGITQGAMIALRVPAGTAARIAHPGGLPPQDLHVTLAYLGDARALTSDQIPAIHEAAREAATSSYPLEGRVPAGSGTFNNPDEQPYWFDPGTPGIVNLRESLMRSLQARGLDHLVANNHPFTPHITMAYLDPDEAPPQDHLVPSPAPCTWTDMDVVLGDELPTTYPLGGRHSVVPEPEIPEPEPFPIPAVPVQAAAPRRPVITPATELTLRRRVELHNRGARLGARASLEMAKAVYSRSGSTTRVSSFLRALSTRSPHPDQDLFPASFTPTQLSQALALASEYEADDVQELVVASAGFPPSDPRRAFHLNRALAAAASLPSARSKALLAECLRALVADGNSTMARSIRAKRQLRDRFGKWIEMGGGIRFKVRSPGAPGGGQWFHGKVEGIDVPNGRVDVRLEDGKLVKVPANKVEQPKAIIKDPNAQPNAPEPDDPSAPEVSPEQVDSPTIARLPAAPLSDLFAGADDAAEKLAGLIPDDSTEAKNRDKAGELVDSALVDLSTGNVPAQDTIARLNQAAEFAQALSQKGSTSPAERNAFRAYSEDVADIAAGIDPEQDYLAQPEVAPDLQKAPAPDEGVSIAPVDTSQYKDLYSQMKDLAGETTGDLRQKLASIGNVIANVGNGLDDGSMNAQQAKDALDKLDQFIDQVVDEHLDDLPADGEDVISDVQADVRDLVQSLDKPPSVPAQQGPITLTDLQTAQADAVARLTERLSADSTEVRDQAGDKVDSALVDLSTGEMTAAETVARLKKAATFAETLSTKHSTVRAPEDRAAFLEYSQAITDLANSIDPGQNYISAQPLLAEPQRLKPPRLEPLKPRTPDAPLPELPTQTGPGLAGPVTKPGKGLNPPSPEAEQRFKEAFDRMARDGIKAPAAPASNGVVYGSTTVVNDVAPDEIDALENYMTSGFKNINKHLRGLPTTAAWKQDQAYALVTIQKLNDLAGRSTLNEDVPVYRGIYVTSQSNLSLEVGSVIEDKGFTSVSRDDSPAEVFGNTLLEFTLPKGTNVIDAMAIMPDELLDESGDKLSDPSIESELILPPGSRFKVVSNNGGRYQLELMTAQDVLPEPALPRILADQNAGLSTYDHLGPGQFDVGVGGSGRKFYNSNLNDAQGNPVPDGWRGLGTEWDGATWHADDNGNFVHVRQGKKGQYELFDQSNLQKSNGKKLPDGWADPALKAGPTEPVSVPESAAPTGEPDQFGNPIPDYAHLSGERKLSNGSTVQDFLVDPTAPGAKDGFEVTVGTSPTIGKPIYVLRQRYGARQLLGNLPNWNAVTDRIAVERGDKKTADQAKKAATDEKLKAKITAHEAHVADNTDDHNRPLPDGWSRDITPEGQTIYVGPGRYRAFSSDNGQLTLMVRMPDNSFAMINDFADWDELQVGLQFDSQARAKDHREQFAKWLEGHGVSPATVEAVRSSPSATEALNALLGDPIYVQLRKAGEEASKADFQNPDEKQAAKNLTELKSFVQGLQDVPVPDPVPTPASPQIAHNLSPNVATLIEDLATGQGDDVVNAFDDFISFGDATALRELPNGVDLPDLLRKYGEYQTSLTPAERQELNGFADDLQAAVAPTPTPSADLSALSDEEIAARITAAQQNVPYLLKLVHEVNKKIEKGGVPHKHDIAQAHENEVQIKSRVDEVQPLVDEQLRRLGFTPASEPWDSARWAPAGVPVTNGNPVSPLTDEQFMKRRDWYVANDQDTLNRNAELRAGSPGAGAKSWRTQMNGMVNDQLLEDDARLHRGGAFTPEFIAGLKPGATITDPGILSTADSADNALFYADARHRLSPGTQIVHFEILAPKGTPLADVSYGEFVLGSDSNMRIREVSRDDAGIIHVTTELNGTEYSPVPGDAQPQGVDVGGSQDSTSIPVPEGAVFGRTVLTGKATLTADEAISYNKYTGDSYTYMNKLLRDGKLGDPKTEKRVSPWNDALTGLIDRSFLSEDVTVYRGMHDATPQLGNLQVGSVITDKGFTSTTADEAIAETFADTMQGDEHKAAIFRINLPAGTNAVDVDALDPSGEGVQTAGGWTEQEYLLRPGSRFKVTAITPSSSLDQPTRIDLQLQPQEAHDVGQPVPTTSTPEAQQPANERQGTPALDAGPGGGDTAPAGGDAYGLTLLTGGKPTTNEQVAFEQYTSSAYHTMNDLLRNGSLPDGDPSSPWTTESVNQRWVDDLTGLIARSTMSKDTTVWRGMYDATKQLGNLQVGSVIQDKGFTSTSANQEVAASFAAMPSNQGASGAALFRIKLPAGANALDVDAHDVNADPEEIAMEGSEEEVLLPPGSRFRVTAITPSQYSDQPAKIDLELLPQETMADSIPAQTAPAAKKTSAPTPTPTPVADTPSGIPDGFNVVPHAQRGLPGDGYHASGPWGKYGASGLLVRAPGDNGEMVYLIAQRGQALNSNKGKWQFPGGAIDQNETSMQGAAREFAEELAGADGQLGNLVSKGQNVYDNGKGWQYTTHVAELPKTFDTHALDFETDGVEWVTADKLRQMRDNGELVPALAGSLDNVLNAFGDPPAPAAPEKPKPEEVKPTTPGVTHDVSNWTKIGGQGGSNPGGVYQAPDGSEYYVKQPQTPEHAHNEVLASQLYAELGVNAANVTLGEVGPGGDLRIVSKMIDGAKPDLYAKLKDQEYKAQLQSGFAVDAWLANWDVAGLVFDNVVTGADGKPYRIDGGGALIYRAMGSPKGALFGDKVGELSTLRNADMAPTASEIFGPMSEADIKESAKALLDVTPNRIAEVVNASGFDQGTKDGLISKLVARRENILDQYGLLTPDAVPNDTVVTEAAKAVSVKLNDPAVQPTAVGKVRIAADGVTQLEIGMKVRSLKDGTTGVVHKHDPSDKYVKIKRDSDGKVMARATKTLQVVTDDSTPAPVPTPTPTPTQAPEPAAVPTPTTDEQIQQWEDALLAPGPVSTDAPAVNTDTAAHAALSNLVTSLYDNENTQYADPQSAMSLFASEYDSVVADLEGDMPYVTIKPPGGTESSITRADAIELIAALERHPGDPMKAAYRIANASATFEPKKPPSESESSQPTFMIDGKPANPGDEVYLYSKAEGAYVKRYVNNSASGGTLLLVEKPGGPITNVVYGQKDLIWPNAYQDLISQPDYPPGTELPITYTHKGEDYVTVGDKVKVEGSGYDKDLTWEVIGYKQDKNSTIKVKNDDNVVITVATYWTTKIHPLEMYPQGAELPANYLGGDSVHMGDQVKIGFEDQVWDVVGYDKNNSTVLVTDGTSTKNAHPNSLQKELPETDLPAFHQAPPSGTVLPVEYLTGDPISAGDQVQVGPSTTDIWEVVDWSTSSEGDLVKVKQGEDYMFLPRAQLTKAPSKYDQPLGTQLPVNYTDTDGGLVKIGDKVNVGASGTDVWEVVGYTTGFDDVTVKIEHNGVKQDVLPSQLYQVGPDLAVAPESMPQPEYEWPLGTSIPQTYVDGTSVRIGDQVDVGYDTWTVIGYIQQTANHIVAKVQGTQGDVHNLDMSGLTKNAKSVAAPAAPSGPTVFDLGPGYSTLNPGAQPMFKHKDWGFVVVREPGGSINVYKPNGTSSAAFGKLENYGKNPSWDTWEPPSSPSPSPSSSPSASPTATPDLVPGPPPGTHGVMAGDGNMLYPGSNVIGADGQVGVVKAIEPNNKYAKVKFPSGVKARAISKLKVTGYQGKTGNLPQSQSPVQPKPKQPVYVPPATMPDGTFNVPTVGGTANLQGAIAYVNQSIPHAISGISVATDSGDVEDLDMRMTRVKVDGEERLLLKFKLTSDAGTRLNKRKDADGWVKKHWKLNRWKKDPSGMFNIDTKHGGLSELKYSNSGEMSVLNLPGDAHIEHRVATLNSNGPKAFQNMVEIYLPTNSDETAIRQALFAAGVDNPSAATQADVNAFIENRMISMLDGFSNPTKNLDGAPRQAALDRIKQKYGVTAEAFTVEHGPGGRIDVVAPQELRDELAVSTGVKALSHNVSMSGAGKELHKLPAMERAEAYLAFLQGLFTDEQGLRSTVSRWSEGVFSKGQSSAKDVGTGGADYVFMSPSSKLPEVATTNDDYYGNNPGGLPSVKIYADPRNTIFRNLAWNANQSDEYGRRLSGNILARTTSYVHEIMPKGKVAWDQLHSVRMSEWYREQLVNRLKSHGVTHIGSRTVDEFFPANKETIVPPPSVIPQPVIPPVGDGGAPAAGGGEGGEGGGGVAV